MKRQPTDQARRANTTLGSSMRVVWIAVTRKGFLKYIFKLFHAGSRQHLTLRRKGERVDDSKRGLEGPADKTCHPSKEYRVSSTTVLAARLGRVAWQIHRSKTVFKQEKFALLH